MSEDNQSEDDASAGRDADEATPGPATGEGGPGPDTDEESPLTAPEGNWWNRKVNRRETIWLGITGGWAVALFGWMLGWTEFGEQNQMGETYEVSTERFQEKVSAFKDEAGEAEAGVVIEGEDVYVPPGEDVYVGALQWSWDGLPVVLEAGTEYRFHLGSYDVQHGFSVRHEDNLSKQMSLQVLPGYEWVVPMEFDETGTYHVVCNEFCGEGHRSMHGKFVVREELPDVEFGASDDEETGDYGGWFTDETGGETANYEGSTADETGSDQVTVAVGTEGNGGDFAFSPPAVTVSPGTTVTFEWASDNHNVVVDSAPDGASWQGHESIENEGFSFEHTFETEGVYRYYCDPHLAMGMKGVVEVN